MSSYKDAWPNGIDNKARVDRLAEGFVRGATNVDFTAQGAMQLRSGYELVAALTDVRAALPYGENLVIADGTNLKLFDTSTATIIDLGSIAAAGFFSGAELDGVFYGCTPAERFAIDGTTRMAWGVEAPSTTLTTTTGALKAGNYRIAVTAVDAQGVESGVVPYVVSAADLAGYQVGFALPDGAVSARLYATVENGDTLFRQDERVTGAFVLTSVRNDTARLMTENLTPPPPAEQMHARNSRLLMVLGEVLYFTEPFAPHLHHRLRGFIKFPQPISVALATDGVVFVCADKTYAISDIGLESQSMRTVLAFGAVPGSGVIRPDNSAAWMTKYGMAVGLSSGAVELPNRTRYAPPVPTHGASSVVENNGSQMFVTTLLGGLDQSGLGLRDDYDLEIE